MEGEELPAALFTMVLVFIFLLAVFQSYSGFLSRAGFLERERAAGSAAALIAGSGVVQPDSLEPLAGMRLALSTGEWNLTLGETSGKNTGASSLAVLVLENGEYLPGRLTVYV